MDKSLSAAKSVQEVVELQTSYAKTALEAYMAEMGRMTEIVSASVKDSMKPLNERVTDMVEKMQAALKAAKKPCEIVIYDGAPHGFHADYRPSYRETPAKDGWQRLRAWFQQNGAA